MTRKMVAADSLASKRKRAAPVLGAERLWRVRLACEALVAEGRPFRFVDVTDKAGLPLNALHRDPALHELVRQARVDAASKAAAAAVWTSTLPARSHDAETVEESVPLGAIENGALPGPGELNVGELAANYLAGRVERGELQANSARVAQERLAGFVDRCGHLAPSALTRPMLLRWQATVGRLAPSTRRHYIGQVRRFCAWLTVEGLVASDPAVTLVMPREPRRAPRALSRADVASLQASASESERQARGAPWAAPVIALMVGCGLRCVEVSRLDLADYDDYKKTVTVRGKGGHERVLPVPAVAAKVLEAYIAQRGAVAGPLFKASGSKSAPDGRISARWISRRTGRLMAQAGVHHAGDGRSAHALRHTAASDVLDKCKDVRVVQQMLGHESLATTQIYLRSADLGRMRKAMAGRDYSKPAKVKTAGKKARKKAEKAAAGDLS